MESGTRVAVLGLGKSGYESACFLQAKGYEVFVSELGNSSAAGEFAKLLAARGIDCETGRHTMDRILGMDWVLISPGISPKTSVYKAISEKGLPVYSEIEVASWFCASRQIIAVTGSSGKTTVCTLLARMLEAAGREVVCCGNIGTPWIAQLARIRPETTVVLELSSFQLFHCRGFRPHVGVLLNLSPNHQDWHKDMQEYADAKLRLFQNQEPEDAAVIRKTDLAGYFPAYNFRAGVTFFDGAASENPNHDVVRAVASILNLPESCCEAVLREFRGLEHRMEEVETIHGVTYVNDSKSTTTASLAWALRKFPDGKVLLIAGGIAKSADYADIRELIRQKVRQIFLIGRAAPVLREAWAGTVPLFDAEN